MIYDLATTSYCIFAGRRVTFCFFGRFWIVFFLIFLSWLWRRFLHLVGVWGWGHINVLSFPVQWCYALGFLRLMWTGQWCYAILNAMTVYREDCLAGIVKLSPSDAFKVAKLHWMSWSTGKERCWCVGRWRFATFFHWKFPEIMTNPQFQAVSADGETGVLRVVIYSIPYPNPSWPS